MNSIIVDFNEIEFKFKYRANTYGSWCVRHGCIFAYVWLIFFEKNMTTTWFIVSMPARTSMNWKIDNHNV